MLRLKDFKRMSEMDDEEAVKPMDYTLADLDEMQSTDEKKDRQYAEFYDDVKTAGGKLNKRDW